MSEQKEGARFGPTVRARRLEKGLGLRELARMVGMSATYMSKVERGEFGPPIEAKIRAIAEALGENPDELLALAGKVASELDDIIRSSPQEMATFLRTVRGYSPAEMQQLTEVATKLKKE
jgi:HTH-type transcriptional regulator, competence development regulator